MPDVTPVTSALAHIRETEGLTQELAAARVPVSPRQWQRWETGETTPQPKNIRLIADAFGLPVETFFASAVPSRLDRIEAQLSDLLDIARRIALLLPDERAASEILREIAEAAEPTLRLIEDQAAKQPPTAQPQPRTQPPAGTSPGSDPKQLPDAGNGRA
jgi:transcriptional regulator with XRE-family HTH domain